MKKLLILSCLIGLSLSLQAQRYGHLNFSGLLAQMPESTAAEAELQALNDQLVTEGEEKVAALEAAYLAYQQAEAGGEESPNQLRQRATTIQGMQQELANFEQSASQRLDAKRAELLEPVVTQAQQAVETVAQANGFLMIFDTGVFNAILFAKDSEDIMPMVKDELGIVDEEEK